MGVKFGDPDFEEVVSPARHVLRRAIIVNTTWHVNNRGDESAAAPHAGDRPVRARNWQDDCGHILVGPVHGLQRATVLCGPSYASPRDTPPRSMGPCT